MIFFFQAEDGIRDRLVTGVQTCALPIYGHTQVVVFTLLLGAMVGIIARNGGTMGIVKAVTPFAHNARRGKLATAFAGLGIFFDDYANTPIVGNTMRPITERLKISRERSEERRAGKECRSRWSPDQ